MADEPNGTTGDPGSQPPPLAEAPPPPLADPPPPAAAVPPPATAAPAPPAPKPFCSPPVVLALVVVLILAVLALLYFGGVFERLSNQRSEQTSAPAAVRPAGEATPPGTGGDLAQPDMAGPDGAAALPPCGDVYSEAAAAALPRDDRQRNSLAVSASGEYLWNGAAVDAVRLRQYLDIVATMSPTPLTVVSVAPGAPPGAVDALREVIGRSLNCRFRPS